MGIIGCFVAFVKMHYSCSFTSNQENPSLVLLSRQTRPVIVSILNIASTGRSVPLITASPGPGVGVYRP